MNEIEIKLMKSAKELPKCEIAFENIKEQKETCKNFFFHVQKFAIACLLMLCIIITGIGVYAANAKVEKGMWLVHTSYFYIPIKINAKLYDLDAKLKIDHYDLQKADYYGVVDHGKSKLEATMHPDYRLFSLTYKNEDNIVDIYVGKMDNAYWKTFFHYDEETGSVGIMNDNYKILEYDGKNIYVCSFKDPSYDTAYYIDFEKAVCLEINSNENNIEDIIKMFVDSLDSGK